MSRMLACLLLCVGVGSAEATTENAALALALEDLKTLPRAEQLFTRYIWVTDGEFESIQASSLAVNYVSREPLGFRPFYRVRNIQIKVNGVLHKKRIVVMRIPLRAYASVAADLDDFVKQWENFQFDPRFNLLLTKDTLKFAGVAVKNTRRTIQEKVKRTRQVIKTVPLFEQDGKYYNKMYVDEEYEETVDRVIEVSPLDRLGKDVDVLRVVSEHVDPRLISELIDLTQSQAPVTNHRYFISRALSTIKGKGLFTVVYGGLYYELSGIKKGFKKGTDEDNFLAKLGIGNVEQGINAKKIFDDIRSDQRVAQFKSGVTGKPRRVDLLKTLAGRDNQGIVSITHDLKDEDIDIGTHPMMNLVAFKDRAREGIYEKQNGLSGFFLFDGEGALQDEVPPDVAADTTIPSPHGTRLQPAIGCIRCHKKEGGWRVSNNDVQTLTRALDIFNDQTDRKVERSQILARLAGQYAGNLEFKIFPRARDDYASAILRVTGPWKKSLDQTDVVKLSGDKLEELYGQYNYESVNAEIALRELDVPGIDPKDAAKTLRKLLPPVQIVVEDEVKFRPEDARIGALFSGLSINRSDWDLVYSFVATRLDLAMKP